MALSPQQALIYLMAVTASSDAELTEAELAHIDSLVARLPVFRGVDRQQVPILANAAVELINKVNDIERVLDQVIAAVPERLHDTAYALAVEIATVDLTLQQEELRFLEMLRDCIKVDRLVTAAIEAAARARYRGA